MKITQKSVLVVGSVVWLPSEEICVIKEICREPDGIYYKVQFVEEDGEEYVNDGGERVMAHYELVGGEV